MESQRKVRVGWRVGWLMGGGVKLNWVGYGWGRWPTATSPRKRRAHPILNKAKQTQLNSPSFLAVRGKPKKEWMNWWSECGESAARPEANHSSISSSLLISFHSHSMKTKKRFHSKDVLKLADIITVLDCTNRYCNDLGWSVVRCEKPIEHRYILFSFH